MSDLPYSQRMFQDAYRDVRENNDAYFSNNLAHLGFEMEQEQIRQVAEIGAQELEQYGAEGQRWAANLRQNPTAAYKMAELQGGFGEITRRLAYAQAAGTDAISQRILEREGAQGFSSYGAGEANLALSGVRGAEESVLRDAFGIGGSAPGGASVGGAGGGGSAGGGVGGMSLDDMARLAIVNPDLAKVLFQLNTASRERTGSLDSTIAGQLNTKFTQGAANFVVQRDYYETAVAAAEEAASNPAAAGSVDFALVQAYGKMLDPNSVVRNEEGKFIVESQSSVVQDKINEFLRLFNTTGTLNPTARYNLMKQIEAKYRQAERQHNKYLAEMDKKLDAMGATPFFREQARPIGIEPSALRLNLVPWADAAGQERTPGVPTTSTPQRGLIFKPGMKLVPGEQYLVRDPASGELVEAIWDEASQSFDTIE